MSRVRVVGWNVQPIVMVDDGEHLTPVQVGAQMVPSIGWDEFKQGGDDLAIESIRDQIEASE